MWGLGCGELFGDLLVGGGDGLGVGFFVIGQVFGVNYFDIGDVEEIQYGVQVVFVGCVGWLVGMYVIGGGDDYYFFVVGQVNWVVFGVVEGFVGDCDVIDLGFELVGDGEVVYWCVDYYDVGGEEFFQYFFIYCDFMFQCGIVQFCWGVVGGQGQGGEMCYCVGGQVVVGDVKFVFVLLLGLDQFGVQLVGSGGVVEDVGIDM